MSRLKMPRSIPTLRGDLVTLRPIDPIRDAPDYYEMNMEPEMHLWTGNRVLESHEEARVELRRFADMDDVSTWMIVDNPSGKVVGRFFICLEDPDGTLVAGEGTRIAKPYWRKGHNREARRLVFSYVFEELLADRIETEAWTGNTNSVRSIESYGFRLVEVKFELNPECGKRMEKRHYRLSREEWERHHKR